MSITSGRQFTGTRIALAHLGQPGAVEETLAVAVVDALDALDDARAVTDAPEQVLDERAGASGTR